MALSIDGEDMNHKIYNGIKFDPNVKAFIKQPDGVNYLLQRGHYSRYYAQEYLDMLISKAQAYLDMRRSGKTVVQHMSTEKLEETLANLTKCEIIDI